MNDRAAAEIQRRIRFMTIALGVMLGFALSAIVVSIYNRSPLALISVLPLVICFVPLSRQIRRARQELSGHDF